MSNFDGRLRETLIAVARHFEDAAYELKMLASDDASEPPDNAYQGSRAVYRCRVEGFNRIYCPEMLAEVAMIYLRSFDDYHGIARDPLAYDALRKDVEREVGAAAGENGRR